MPNEPRTYDLHIHIFPAQDVPGAWLALCLDFDVVSQGSSLEDAMSMIREAVELTAADDLAQGRDPALRRAPKEDWDAFWREAITGATARPIDAVVRHEAAVRHVAIFPTLTVHRAGRAGTQDARTSYEERGLALTPDLDARASA